MTELRRRMTAATPAAVRFKTIVDHEVATNDVFEFPRWQVALMGQISGDPRYCNFAVAETDAYVADEESRIRNGTATLVQHDSYLEVGDRIGSMAMVYDWCRGFMTPAQRERWKNFGNQAVWNVWNHTNARWGSRAAPWTGWSVNNPVNNYYYSFLEATMMLGLATYGENEMAPGWLDQFRITKLENQLFPTFNTDLIGGGSREGTGYGTAMMNLWNLYDWWERSTGERLADRTPHTLESMYWLVHSVTPTLDRIIPTGDHSRDSDALFYDYHRDYLLKLATLYPGEAISGVVKTLLSQSSVRQMTNTSMRYSDFLYDLTPINGRSLNSLSTAYWGSGTGSFSMRNDWSTTSAYANFICGPVTESHAHEDQGSFVLFKGTWLAYDANIDGKSGISEEQFYHNTVRFQTSSGVEIGQTFGRSCNMRALANTVNWTYALAQVTSTYAPSAGIAKSEREFVFIKPSTFVVFDRVQTNNAGTRRIFTMNFPFAPTINGPTTTLIRGANRLDMTRILPAAANTSITMWRDVNSNFVPPVRTPPLPPIEAARLNVVDAGSDGSAEFLHVIGLDGSVAGAVASNSGGQSGVDISLADGRRAIVRFSQNGTGGTVEIRSSNGMVIETTTLPTSIQAPPLFVN
jgi:hypothetical protein